MSPSSLVSYLVSRRLLLTVLIGAVTVASRRGRWPRTWPPPATVTPRCSRTWTIKPAWGCSPATRRAVAEVDLDATQPVRLAGIGADDTTPMEVGSMTKAMTGLVIADAVRRGEIRMDAPVATYLPS